MTRLLLLPIALVVVSLNAAPAEAKRWRTYVSCGVSDSTYTTPPSHSCPVGDLPQSECHDGSPAGDTRPAERDGARRVSIETWNDNPKPFVWTKTADQILDSIARYCDRINESRH